MDSAFLEDNGRVIFRYTQRQRAGGIIFQPTISWMGENKKRRGILSGGLFHGFHAAGADGGMLRTGADIGFPMPATLAFLSI